MTDPKAKAASRIDGAEQTPGQWAVRWHGVALFALLTLSVPLWHLTWHGVLGHRHPVVRTRDETPRPPLSSATFFDGTWMSRLERHLQSSSPIVWQLRGFYNEQRYRLGLFSSDEVHCGGDDWFYVGSTLRPDFARFDERENAAARAEFLRRLRQRADELGLLLVVAVVPDKVRIHPEHAYPGGEMPAEKAAAYGRILAEFEAAEIATADLARAISEARVVSGEAMYYQRDTHWRAAGALAAARAVAAVIESRLGPEELGPRLPVELGPLMTARVVSDLVAMAGFRAFEEDTGSEYPVVMPASGLASRLAENKHYYSVQLPGDPSRQILDTEWFEQARVLLAGTSFAADNGANALMLVLGRPVDAKTIPGADGLLPLADQLARAAAEPGRFRVLVWEFVERGIFTPSWRRPGRRVRW